jgi:hypothetical protein
VIGKHAAFREFLPPEQTQELARSDLDDHQTLGGVAIGEGQ